ncbi:MAG: hypothetical protein PHO86_02195 [Bacilli bacterium]|nr:hypothetical protein [Bacilli bacterium]
MNKKYFRKKVYYLLLVWFSLFISIGIVILMYLLEIKEIITSLVVFFLLVYLLFMLFFCKTKITFYDMQQRYQELLKKSVGSIKTNCKFDNNWLKFLEKHNYQLFVNNSNVTIYFKIEKSLSKKTFISTSLIEIVTIIKKQELDAYTDQIEDELKKLWAIYEKEYHLNKQIIMQFKKYNNFSEDIKKELDRIISYKEGDNYLININCGYIENEAELYFLHSNEYYPNRYYKYAVDIIKEITNL